MNVSTGSSWPQCMQTVARVATEAMKSMFTIRHPPYSSTAKGGDVIIRIVTLIIH